MTNYFFYAFAFALTLSLTLLSGRILIPILKSRAKQPIYTDGPSWHISKSGTPTMGGISFIISVGISLTLSALYKMLLDDYPAAISILLCLGYTLLNATVGIIDDLTKLKHKENAGLTPRSKLIFQFISAALFIYLRSVIFGSATSIDLGALSIDLGIIYYPVALIILVGITNCANLTDGIDGLAASVAFAIGISLFYVSFYTSDTASFICAALVGCSIGFLVFNLHPAKIFMGDTGSLFLGSLIASLAFELGNPLIAVLSGGVYVLEGISVILQVLVFKISKKRLFKMAPFHHHLEKCGWDENKICVCAILISVLLSSAVIFLR